MTDNMDEFDQDQFDPMDEAETTTSKAGVKHSLMDAWRSKPMFKLLVIMGVVSVAMAGALGAFSSEPTIQAARIAQAPSISEAPGGTASPFFIEQNKQANEQRIDRAIQEGGSAMPTPVGSDVDLSELTEKTKKDPLLEFRAETERLKQELRAEQRQSAQQVQVLQQQMRQKPTEQDDTLARAMQKQMQDLMKSWAPGRMAMVQGTEPVTTESTLSSRLQEASSLQMANASASQQAVAPKAIIPAGVVNYAQLLTEANSDVPGPILAQILSGPLTGGRAIGKFEVMNDFLVLTFTNISYKGKDYPVNVLALDPDTTLGGMATEVDHRYVTRLLLPAAASFASAFGDALADGDSETTVAGDSVIVTQSKKGYQDATYSGLGQMGKTLSQFFQAEANNTKALIRVGVGTPMGLFFLQSVQDPSTVTQPEQTTESKLQEMIANAYKQQSVPAGGQTYNTQALSLESVPSVRVLTSGESNTLGNTTIYKK